MSHNRVSIVLALFLASCTSQGKILLETPLFPNAPIWEEQQNKNSLADLTNDTDAVNKTQNSKNKKTDEIRALIENGQYNSLKKAISLITDEYKIDKTEFGRLMSAIGVIFLRDVYTDVDPSLPSPDPPKTNLYTKILNDSAQGVYRKPESGCKDYLELILPTLSLIDVRSRAYGGLSIDKNQEALFSIAIADLKKAASIKPDGVLAVYFLGLAYERSGNQKDAAVWYKKALTIDAEFFPAMLGEARVSKSNSLDDSILQMFVELSQRYPENLMVLRHLATAYYDRRKWQEASVILAQVLNKDRHNAELMLQQVRTQIELASYINAQVSLDTYNSEFPETRDSRFYLARLQYEGFKNQDGALSILLTLHKNNPDDYEIRLYLTKILITSDNKQEQEEGRQSLARLMNDSREKNVPVSIDVLTIAVEDALKRSSWNEARGFLQRILPQRRSASDLLNSYQVESALGNKKGALSLARELREKYPQNEESSIAYISALIDNGRQQDAKDLIDKRLAFIGAGVYKSRYYFLRSQIQSGAQAISDLRLSLFENPRNIDALKAIFVSYNNAGDEKRAVYYLRQAIALSPNDPDIIRYQKKYDGKL
ncbi:MAG: hypothetical protein Ta2B_23850 [Termitinemataceae bacterium]|nr:MAG: hypothetical protein Ta2B_23850 [Termitinemataceae bacterium]